MKYAKVIFSLLCVALLAALPALAQSSNGPWVKLKEEQCVPNGDWSNDDAFEGYLRQKMGLGATGALFEARNLGGALTGVNKVVNQKLKTLISSVAEGNLASTVFKLSVSELGIGTQYTAAQLGVDEIITSENKVSDEAKAALLARLKKTFDLNTQTRVLLHDCPYELYWYNKTSATRLTYPTMRTLRGSTAAKDVIYFSGEMIFRFPVAKEYAGSEDYTFDTSLAAKAKAAAAKAKSIVQQYASADDYSKLKGYKETICALTDYNDDAAGDSANFGNPWQLVWVFDGDKSTKVVCEGYAKAFQYLCDMTQFNENEIYCICVTGTFKSPALSGGHMWNIVRMPNGKNYLVDLTNCDVHDDGSAAIGAPDRLFMKAPTSGSASAGYIYKLSSAVSYAYKEETTSLFSTAELTLSDSDYLEDVIAINEDNFPDAAFRSFVAKKYDDGDGYLYPSEIILVSSMNVSGKGIASLKGLEHFSNLTALDCSKNAIAELDLSANEKLKKLLCDSNKLLKLDLTDCARLRALVIPSNLVNDGTTHYKSSTGELRCDAKVQIITQLFPEDTLYLPSGLDTIDDGAFEGVAAEAIVVPEGVTVIGSRAFADCENLAEILLPVSIQSIADDAFEGTEDVRILSANAAIRKWASAHGLESAES